MSIIITIASDKGGVGKTASTAALGHLLAEKGYSVLLIDSDPQGNLSSKFGYTPQERYDNYIGNLITEYINNSKQHPISYYINKTDDVDIIISDQRLDATYGVLSNTPVLNTLIFKNIIQDILAYKQYDFILFDTRPALRSEVGAALAASDWVLIPVLAANDAISGANDILEFSANIRQLNPKLKTLGVFFNRIQTRTKAFKEANEFLRGEWENYVLDTWIPQSQDVVNAENNDSPVTKAYPHSKASKAFISLMEEVLARVIQK